MLLQSTDADTGAPLTDTEIRDEVFTLFVAGHETTALTLTWLFTLLEQRDDVVQQMRAEVAEVLGDASRLSGFPEAQGGAARDRRDAPPARAGRDERAHRLGRRQHPRLRGEAGDIVLPFFWGATATRTSGETRSASIRALHGGERARPRAVGLRAVLRRAAHLHRQQLLAPRDVLVVAMFLQRFDFKMVPGQTIEPVLVATLRPSAPVRVSVRRTQPQS